jgi:hypothetical protein
MCPGPPGKREARRREKAEEKISWKVKRATVTDARAEERLP